MNNVMKHLAGAAAMLAGLIALEGTAAAQQQVAPSPNVLRVGISYSSPTFSWYDIGTGSNKGIMVDLMSAVGKDTGMRVTFSGAVLNDLGDLLTANKIDVIATVWVANAERAKVADFSSPVYVFGEAPLVRKGDPAASFKTLADLKGKTVAPAIYDAQLRGSGVEMNVLPSPGTTAAILEEVRSGKANLALFTAPTTVFFASQGEEFDWAKGYVPTFTQPLGVAVRKGDTALLDRMNKSLAKLMADGTVKAIWAKYGLEWTQPKAN